MSRLRSILDNPLSRIAAVVPFSPNTLTIMCWVLSSCAGYVLAQDLLFGGIAFLAASSLDMLDGAVARAKGIASEFGAFLDSLLDRYADAAMFLGVAWNLHERGSMVGAVLAIVALVGALLVSYARSKAEGLGVPCSIGLMERTERILVLCGGAISGLIIPALWITAVLTHVTVGQRFYHVRREFQRRLG